MDDAKDIDVFISYSHQGKAWVRDVLKPRLVRWGLEVAIDRDHFPPGSDLASEILTVLRAARSIVFVVTPDFSRSYWTRFELDAAVARKRENHDVQLIPVVIDDCEVPDELANLVWCDLSERDDSVASWRNLSRVLGIAGPEDIQDLIDRAQDESTVRIPAGRYIVQASLLITRRKGLRIECASPTEILLDNVQEACLRIQFSDGITLTNATIQHLSPLEQYACEGSVVSARKSRNVTLEGCEFSGCGATGIDAQECANLVVRGCHVHHNTWCAIELWHCVDSVFEQNVIEDNRASIIVHESAEPDLEATNIVRRNGEFGRDPAEDLLSPDDPG